MGMNAPKPGPWLVPRVRLMARILEMEHDQQNCTAQRAAYNVIEQLAEQNQSAQMLVPMNRLVRQLNGMRAGLPKRRG
jgi:hypothetical protein